MTEQARPFEQTMKSNCDNCGRLLLDILAGTRNEYGTFCSLNCSIRFSKQLHNAHGKKVKRRRFVISRADPLATGPRPCMYLTKNGLCTYHIGRAVIYKNADEAQLDLEYFQNTYPRFTWTIEPE
jgi:hypothetical protein